ncbi:ribonuclease H, partial [Trifolium pratense]
MAASCWCRPIVRDSDVAEGMTLLLGMEFAKDMLFKDMKINSDSANVIAAFNSDNMQHNYLGTIALECSNLISRFNNIVIAHVRREANQAAHYLA